MTENELLLEVELALSETEDPEGFYTSKEWAQMFNLAVEAARARLHKLAEAGYLEHAKVRRVSPLSGVETSVIAYKFVRTGKD